MDQSIVGCDGLSCDICSFISSLADLISLLIAISFSFSLFFSVVSGFVRIFSWGDERKIKFAKNGLKYSLYGFAVCLLSYLLVGTIYKTLDFRGGSWWKIECSSGLVNEEGEGEAELKKYPNELPLGEVGSRSNPALIDNLASWAEKAPAETYFFIRGLGAQPVQDSVADLKSTIEKAKSVGKDVFAVVPNSAVDNVVEVEPKLVNLGEMLDKDSKKTVSNLANFLKTFSEFSPNGILPLIKAERGKMPVTFKNDWPKDENLKALAGIRNGVVYEENPIFSNSSSSDDSGFTINLKYDEKVGQYYLDPDKPVSLKFDPGVDRRAAEEVAVQIAETVSTLLPNNKYEDIYPTINTLMGSAEKTSATPLPSALVKTAGSRGVTPEDVGLLESFIQSKIKSQGNQSGGIFSPISAPQAPEDAQPTSSTGIITSGPTGGENALPPSEPIDYSSALPNTEIGERISSVSSYDVSRLKRNVSTDRVLNPEERKELNKMLKGLQQETAEKSRSMNIPSEFMMCIFEKESNFDGGARSETGCSGIGQVCMAETKIAVEHMKKYAPNHYKAFAEKFAQQGKDMEKICSDKVKNYNEKKRELLRSDPNFGAAVAYMLADYKKRGGADKGKPVGNDRDLSRLANNYGPGNSDYSASIMRCMKNNSWLIDRRKKK